MRNIFAFMSVFLMATHGVFAACEVKDFGAGRSNSRFLYPSSSYRESGRAYQCGHGDCTNDDIVFTDIDTKFIGNKETDEWFFVCKTGINNHWERLDRLPFCGSCDNLSGDYEQAEYSIGSSGEKQFFVVDGEQLILKKQVPLSLPRFKLCLCSESSLSAGGTTAPTASSDVPVDEPPAPAASSETPKAHESCDCNAGSVSNAAECHYASINGQMKCVAKTCKSGYYVPRDANGRPQGWCRAGTEPAAPVAPDDDEMGVVVDDAGVESVTDARNECERGVAGYIVYNGECMSQARADQMRQAILAAQAAAEHKRMVDAAKVRIQAIVDNLDEASGTFDRNVWRDADGNFNMTRLAVDGAAGVVLGTAGGLITNKIVKKNQVKRGFEDVKCTVGGQVVAEYGDEFIVGR